jgi:hypothetical protein
MIGFRCADGEIAPAIEVVGSEVVLLISPDDLGMTLVEKSEGTTRRTNVHRLPQAVENQNLIVE